MTDDRFALPTPPPEKCGLVKFHSKQKHSWIESYFRVWTENVNPDRRPSLDIVDPYASFGWCRDEETKDRWAGTAIRAARCLKNYVAKAPNQLFLNTYSPKSAEHAEQVVALRENLAAVGELQRTRVHLSELPVEQAVDAILPRVNKDFPNVWILDPYVASDLPWNVVENIIKNQGQRKITSGKDKGKLVPRKPEMFITLMLWSLQKCANSPTAAGVATKAFGMPEEEWRPILQRYLDMGCTMSDALIELYRDRLMEHYKRPPLSFVVKGVDGNIVYALFFCSDEPAGYHSMRVEGQKHFDEWFSKKYAPVAEELKGNRLEARSEQRAENRKQDTRRQHGFHFDEVEPPKPK